MLPSIQPKTVAAGLSIPRRGVRGLSLDVPGKAQFLFVVCLALVIAIVFIGPLRDPLKNVWVVEFGMIACALVVPFALVMGGVRGIPLGWRLIDCSFGIFGILPLWFCRRLVKQLAEANPIGRPAQR